MQYTLGLSRYIKEKCRLYKIKCDSKYFGQSCRYIIKCFQEHTVDVKFCRTEKSDHVLQESPSIDSSPSKLVKSVQNFQISIKDISVINGPLFKL